MCDRLMSMGPSEIPSRHSVSFLTSPCIRGTVSHRLAAVSAHKGAAVVDVPRARPVAVHRCAVFASVGAWCGPRLPFGARCPDPVIVPCGQAIDHLSKKVLVSYAVCV